MLKKSIDCDVDLIIIKSLSKEKKQLIQKLIISCYIDKLCRKEDDENLGMLQQNSKYTPFKYLATNDIIFIHPKSVLYKHPCDWICTCEVYRGKNRQYIRLNTEVNQKMLCEVGGNLITFSEALQDPSPYYDKANDVIYCYVQPKFRDFWQLDKQIIKFPICENLYRYFAYFLLTGEITGQGEGQIFKENKYKIQPKVIISKSSGAYQFKILELLKILQSKNIFTLKSLCEQWQQQSDFLKDQISSFGDLTKWPLI